MRTMKKYVNIKTDELIARLGYGPAYSPWLNGINKRNHASCDVTITKLIGGKKGSIDRFFSKGCSIDNTNVNKLGNTQLHFVTG